MKPSLKTVISNVARFLLKKILIISLLSPFPLFPDSGDPAQEDQQVKQGNFFLPTAQRLGPLLGVGQFIVDKKDILVLVYADYLKAQLSHSSGISANVIFGIRNDLSIYVSIPAIVDLHSVTGNYAGLADINAQIEYAYWTKQSKTSVNQATILMNLGLVPTGPADLPLARFGNPGVFWGTTISHMDVTWYYYASGGFFYRTRNAPNTKGGNVLVYQAGLGATVGNPGGTILSWLIEASGTYTKPNYVCGVKDPNTGGNEILVGPTMYLATRHTSLHLAGYVPVVQHLFGTQIKDKYYLALGIIWTFND